MRAPDKPRFDWWFIMYFQLIFQKPKVIPGSIHTFWVVGSRNNKGEMTSYKKLGMSLKDNNPDSKAD